MGALGRRHGDAPPLILRAAVSKVDGVVKADASLEAKKAWVHEREDATSPTAIIAAIEKLFV